MGKNGQKQQRIVAVLLCLALIIMLMFCASMVAKQVTHSCCNTSCPVCELLQSSQNALKQLALSACMIAALTVTPVFMRAGLRRQPAGFVCANSLINLKIRINH